MCLYSYYWLLFWYNKIQEIISITLCLLRLALWFKMWPILEKIQWAAENNIYSTAFGWNILLNLFDLWCNLTLKFLCWFCKVSFILWVASLQNMDYLWYLPFLISIFKVDMVNNPLEYCAGEYLRALSCYLKTCTFHCVCIFAMQGVTKCIT
jgi:hypothetical protein